MNKETYLQELRKGLKILPQYDREEAIEFYEEYFDEAGVENEAKVIEELGEPKILAKKILVDVVDRKYEETMAASSGNALAVVPSPIVSGAGTSAAPQFQQVQGTEIPQAQGAPVFGAQSGQYTQAQGAQYTQANPNYEQAFNGQPAEDKKSKKGDQPSALKTLWIVLAAIFALPLSPVIFALLIVACVMIFVAFIVLISFLIAGISILVAGIGTSIFGIVAFFMNPAAAMVVLGGGLVCFGLGIFFILGSLALIRLVAHGLAKGFGRIVHKRNRKNKAAQAVA
ncbi:MAG: DUF1700 domain-containing protein [Saccharofermentanaceae bacterium]|nr:DUF1700 domain-containing protein [Saccharofermentanaceae bacterium]